MPPPAPACLRLCPRPLSGPLVVKGPEREAHIQTHVHTTEEFRHSVCLHSVEADAYTLAELERTEERVLFTFI